MPLEKDSVSSKAKNETFTPMNDAHLMIGTALVETRLISPDQLQQVLKV